MTLDLGSWRTPATANRYSHNYFDRFSIVHAAIGMLFALSNVPAPIAIGAQVAFELVENDLKKVTKGAWPDWKPDGAENHIGDVLTFTAGYYAARFAKSSDAGVLALAGFAALAAAIWTQNLAKQANR